MKKFLILFAGAAVAVAAVFAIALSIHSCAAEPTAVAAEIPCDVVIERVTASDADVFATYVDGDTTVVMRYTEEGFQVIKTWVQ